MCTGAMNKSMACAYSSERLLEEGLNNTSCQKNMHCGMCTGHVLFPLVQYIDGMEEDLHGSQYLGRKLCAAGT
jgi:hypothetical protein